MANDDLRTATVRLVRGRDCWLWVIDRCPFCGKRHEHGGGELSGDPRRVLGTRTPHCIGEHKGSYTLVEG